MTRLARLVLAGALAGAAVLGAPPAQAQHDCSKEPCYECVMYPCYPGDWVQFLSNGTVTYDPYTHTYCVPRAGVCTHH